MSIVVDLFVLVDHILHCYLQHDTSDDHVGHVDDDGDNSDVTIVVMCFIMVIIKCRKYIS